MNGTAISLTHGYWGLSSINAGNENFCKILINAIPMMDKSDNIRCKYSKWVVSNFDVISLS